MTVSRCSTGGFAAAIAFLAWLASGCAQDRILDAGAVCGDDQVDAAEECDVESEGCVECRVQAGFECTSEACTTPCGDQIVAGQEDCDPPDGVSCDSSCRAGSKAEACDMTGYWIVRDTDFSIDDVLSQVQTSTNWYVFHVTQGGAAVAVDRSLFCGLQVSGSVDVTLAPGGHRGLLYRNPQDGSGTPPAQPARSGIFEPAGESCRFELERFYFVRGGEDRLLPTDPRSKPDFDALPPLPFEDNPEHKPDKPFGQNLDGAMDDDGDGFAGIAFQISGNSSGVRNTVQRDHNDYFSDATYVIPERAIEFVARRHFENQENILHVSQCPRLGCGLLLGHSTPAQNLEHRGKWRYLGKDLADPRVAAVIVAELKQNEATDLETCANVRAALPHDPAKK